MSVELCGAACEHGGLCTMPAGHDDDLHSASGRCQWSDEQSIDRASADDRLRLAVAHAGEPGQLAELLIDGTT